MTEASIGLLVPLVSKSDQVSATSDFLLQGYELVHSEPETIQWFALKYATTNTYAIFDTFADQNGRSAHLAGPIAAALMANADQLLSNAPEINHFDVLASTSKHSAKGSLKVGLRVLITAKQGKEQAVKDFLVSAVPLVEAEPNTPLWYAIAFPGTNTFGIVDFFENEAGRNEHLGGQVAAALFANAEALLDGAPQVEMVDVLAAKVDI